MCLGDRGQREGVGKCVGICTLREPGWGSKSTAGYIQEMMRWWRDDWEWRIHDKVCVQKSADLKEEKYLEGVILHCARQEKVWEWKQKRRMWKCKNDREWVQRMLLRDTKVPAQPRKKWMKKAQSSDKLSKSEETKTGNVVLFLYKWMRWLFWKNGNNGEMLN